MSTRTWKKVLSVLLCAVMMFSLCAVGVGAEGTTDVATIGTTGYATLAAAVAEVTDGQTITLLANAAGNGIVVPSGKNFTFDLGGYTYTIDGTTVGSTGTETNGFQLLKDSTITIKNGTINSTKAKILIQNYSNLTLDGVTLDGTNLVNNGSNYTLSNNNGNVVIKDSTIIAAAGGFAFDSCDFSNYTGVTVTVEGNSVINGKIECTNPNGGVNNASIAITGGTFSSLEALKYLAANAVVTVKLASDETADVVVPADTTVTLDLNGHALTGKSANASGWGDLATQNTNTALVNKGTLTVMDSSVAKTGRVSAAGQNASALYNDEGATATLNGGTFTTNAVAAATTQQDNMYVIRNHGTMTLNDGVTVTTGGAYQLSGNTMITNGYEQNERATDDETVHHLTVPAVMTINGGSYTGSIFVVKNGDWSGELTINGGTFANIGTTTASGTVQHWGAVLSNSNNCTATVNGGTFTGYTNGLDPVIKVKNKLADSEGTGLTIKGGTFSISSASGDVIDAFAKTGAAAPILNIEGGTFTGTFNANGEVKDTYSVNTTALAITGGTFSADPAAYLVKGFAATLAEGKYTVDGAAASIGDTYYATLAAAVAAAKDGETVKLLKDVTDGTGIIVNGTAARNFTIDFNNHTYTVSQAPLAGSTGTANQCFQLLKGSTVTMKDGAIVANNANVLMIIQNYCNLTLENMTIDATLGTNNASYAMSNNCGVVNITGSTTIKAKSGQVAFDACWAPNKGYPEGTQVTLDTTGDIVGDIEFDLWGYNVTTSCLTTLDIENCNMTGAFRTSTLAEAAKTNLIINGGSFSDLSGFAYLAAGKTYTLTGLAQTDVTVLANKTIKLDGGSILGKITAAGGTVTGKYGTSYPDVIGPTTVKGAGYRTDNAVFNMTASGIEIVSGDVALSSDYGTNATPITVAKGVTFTIPVGVTFQTWGNVTNNGTINNNGTLKVMKDVFANYGTIKNLGTVVTGENGAVVNHGTITGNAITGAQDATADAVVSDAAVKVASIPATPTTEADKTAVKEAVAAVQAVGSENLVTTATTDATGEVNVGVSADKQETLTKLDTLIQAANTNVKVSVPAKGTEITTDVKVESVTNAALSVDPAATETTTAKVTIAAADAPAANTPAATEIANLQKAGTTPIPVDINLQVNGDNAQPTVPLLIKLDVTGISEPAKLRIVHQHDNSVEVIVPTVSTDGGKTYISFYAATLSTFTIVATSIENTNAFKVTFVPSTENVFGGETYIYDVMLTRVSGSDNVGLVNINLTYDETYLTGFSFQGKKITFNGYTVTPEFTGSILRADFTEYDGLPVADGQSIMLAQIMPIVRNMPDMADGTTIDAAFKAKTATTDSEKTAITNPGYNVAAGLQMTTENTSYRNLTVTLNYGDSANTTKTYYAKYNHYTSNPTVGLYDYTEANGYTKATITDIAALTAPSGKRLYAAAPWLDSAGTEKTTNDLTNTGFTGSAVYTGNWKTEYAITVSGSQGVTYVSGTRVDTTVDPAVTYAAQDIDLVFTANAAPNGYKISAVTYKIGDADAKTLTADENGKYTIPGSEITGPVTVSVAYAPSLSADNIKVFTTMPTEGTTIFTPYSTYSGSKTLVLFKAIEGVTSMAITGATVYKLPADAYTYQDGNNTYAYAFAALIDAHTVTDITAAGMSAFLSGIISYTGSNDTLTLGYTYVNGTIGDAAVVNVQCAYDFASTQKLKWTPTEADLLAADVLTYNTADKTYSVGRDGKVDSADVAAFLYNHAGFTMPVG